MKKLAFAVIVSMSLALPARGQMEKLPDAQAASGTQRAKSPYAGHDSPVKGLTEETLADYRAGSGMGMAIPAELNGYPGPRHLLDLADEVRLSPDQCARLQRMYDEMHAAAVRLGGEIINLEKRLDAAFAGATISESALSSFTRDIAERQGRLRYVHLRAHLAARAMLTPAQVEAYDAARGYSSGSSGATHAH